jgi:arabinoxylan arabinofuranohydrolase
MRTEIRFMKQTKLLTTCILIGTCKVESTGGLQTWKTAACDVADATGVQDLYLKFTGGGGSLFNVDYWKFE